MSNEKYRIIYKDDEIDIREGDCLQPWKCDCMWSDDTPQCYYDADELKQKIARYYIERGEYINRQTTDEFLHDFGIYK